MADLVQLGPDDWETFRDVRLRALADAPDAFGATLAEGLTKHEADWRERLAGDPTYAVVDGGRALAMAGGFAVPGSDAAMVWGMWTDPEARGQGHGRRLLDAVVAWAEGLGRDVYLHVTEGNADARALYVAAGFASTGVWSPLREGSPLRIEELRLSRPA